MIKRLSKMLPWYRMLFYSLSSVFSERFGNSGEKNAMGGVDIERFSPNDVSRTLDWKLGKRTAPPWPELRKNDSRNWSLKENHCWAADSCTGIEFVEGVDPMYFCSVQRVYVSSCYRLDCARQKPCGTAGHNFLWCFFIKRKNLKPITNEFSWGGLSEPKESICHDES